MSAELDSAEMLISAADPSRRESAARRVSAWLLAAIILLLAALSPSSRAAELYGGLGTSGVEGGIGERVGGRVSLRMSGEFLRASRDFESDGATYDTKLKFSNLALYGDYFVSGGGFRLTAGAVVGTRKASGNAVADNGTLSINGSSYPAAGESVGAVAKFPSAAPYFGIGYGHHQPSRGSSFYLDLGVVIGKADAKLYPSAGVVAAAGQANLDAEQRKLGVLSRNRRKFRQPINVACPAPGRWGRPNSRVTSRHFDHGNASRTSRPDCSGLDEAD